MTSSNGNRKVVKRDESQFSSNVVCGSAEEKVVGGTGRG